MTRSAPGQKRSAFVSRCHRRSACVSAEAAEAAERKLKDKKGFDDSTSVRPLLKRLKLERFAASFEESGYGTLATACKVPLTLLEALGMERGDRRLLLTGLARGE